MISIGANGEKIAYGIKHYNLDNEADLAKLEARKDHVMGTTAFVIETSKYFMYNGKNMWVEITPFGQINGGGSGGSGDDDDDDPDHIIYEGGSI